MCMHMYVREGLCKCAHACAVAIKAGQYGSQFINQNEKKSNISFQDSVQMVRGTTEPLQVFGPKAIKPH